ncbi:MAG: PilX N-terminal domain-containing pilus assembly protein [Gammaproteobacteria bacterium]
MMESTYPSSIKRQNGSALVISLLILVVMTILGVTSMSSTSLEENMAANSQNSHVAFQAAESAINAAITANVGFIADTAINPPQAQYSFGSSTISTSSIAYQGTSIKEGASIGKLVSHQFEITGNGLINGAKATRTNIQGVDVTGPGGI